VESIITQDFITGKYHTRSCRRPYRKEGINLSTFPM